MHQVDKKKKDHERLWANAANFSLTQKIKSVKNQTSMEIRYSLKQASIVFVHARSIRLNPCNRRNPDY